MNGTQISLRSAQKVKEPSLSVPVVVRFLANNLYAGRILRNDIFAESVGRNVLMAAAFLENFLVYATPAIGVSAKTSFVLSSDLSGSFVRGKLASSSIALGSSMALSSMIMGNGIFSEILLSMAMSEPQADIGIRIDCNVSSASAMNACATIVGYVFRLLSDLDAKTMTQMDGDALAEIDKEYISE